MITRGVSRPRAEPWGRLVRRVFARVAVAFLVARAYGQTGQPPPGQAPVFETNAQEVSLDLVVHDKKNRPVVDLKPEQIEVTDNGSPVKLTSLRLVSGASEREHLITLLFDPLEPKMMKQARDVAAKILKMIPEKGFSLAVLRVEGRLRLQQGFTSDHKLLEQAVSAATNVETPGQASPSDLPEKELSAVAQTGADASGKPASERDRTLSKTLFSALLESGRLVQNQQAQPSLSGLLALVQSQEKIAQRKAVIYFTHSRQMDSRARSTIEAIVGAANRNGVSIYVIDLNALDQKAHEEFAANITNIGSIPGTVQGATGMQGLPATNQVFKDDARTVRTPVDHTIDNSPVQNLAEGTGGSFIGDEDSLHKPLARMIEDMTTYYEATYAPSNQEYDGSFRPIGVTSLRSGIHIRSSAGYFAMPPGVGIGTRPFELPLLRLLAEPNLPSDLAFRATVLRMGDLPNQDGNTLWIEAPLSDLEIREDVNTNLYSAHLSMFAQIKDNTGAVLEHFGEDIPRRGALDGIEKAKSETVTLQHHFVAVPGEYTLETAILDRNSGKAAAQRVAFVIPAASPGPSLSDLVLVRRMEPFNARRDPLEPLVYGKDRVTPNLSGEASREAKTVSVFFITHPDPHAAATATLDNQIHRKGEPLSQRPVAPARAAGTEAATHLATFPVSSLPDGLYEVLATLSQGGKMASAAISFNLTGGDPESEEPEAAGADLAAPVVESRATGSLAITFPAASTQSPPANELKSLLADTTRHAIGYSALLPNFICVEVTSRSIDAHGQGRWKHQDRMTELLTYRDNAENRTMMEVEVHGLKSQASREDLKGWLSHGEFGGILKSVFAPSSKANFQWKEAGALGDSAIQVFDYRVARENSSFDIHLGNLQRATVGFHGQIFIESTTRNVRRITVVADDVPKRLPIQGASISVDYDYIAINNHDYLLPVDGQVRLRMGRRQEVLNEIEFRNYRRFGSTTKILDYAPVQPR
jgi:VWFA-related protein